MTDRVDRSVAVAAALRVRNGANPTLCKHSSLYDETVAAFASFREICLGRRASGHFWLVAAEVMPTKEV